jgi:GTP-binding protein Era
MPKRTKPKGKYKFGQVAIAGRPNAGKSTLLNALLGTKLAIVSPKPQTTRGTMMGVLTTPNGQAAFFDTPGIHRGDTLINRRMMQSVRAALDGKDLLLYVIDAKTLPDSGTVHEEEVQALDTLRRAAEQSGVPALLVLNKVDLIDDKRLLLPRLEALAKLFPFADLFPIAARKADGLEALTKGIFDRLPEGEARYEEDFLTDVPERNIAAEVIREKILFSTNEEVPHSVAVVIDQWEDKPNVARVAASIIVEKPGQKNIIVGAGGAMIKKIGTAARIELEEMLGRKFFLELFVKVKPKWRENEAFLNELGWQNKGNTL